jgi:hypothetical protein
MEEAKVRINCYRVTPSHGSMPVEQMINTIRRDAIEDRARPFHGEDMRLEQITPVAHKGTGERYYYLDFVRLRDTHGPGRASRARAVEGFELDEDEYFGEETAAMFRPATGYLLLQYNHYGVKPTAVAEYFGQYLGHAANAYELNVKADPDAERVFARQNIIRKVELGIDLTAMNPGDRADGRSLMEMARLAKDLGGKKLKVTISVGMDRKSGLVARTKDSLADFLATENDAVTTAIVSGRENEDSQTELVDLIEHKLMVREVVKLGPDRRFPFDERKKALKRAYDRWQPLLAR